LRTLRARYALAGEGLELLEGVEVVLEGGRVVDIYETSKKTSEVLVMPALVNAHAHLGDCAFPERWLSEGLSEIVDPRRGLKRRALEGADVAEAVEHGMKVSRAAGAFGVADFREGGAEGLREALRAGEPGYMPFGRVEREEELGEVLRLSHGLGLPEPGFPTPELAERAARAFKEAGKPVGLHLAEARREPAEEALRLGADFVVHGCFLDWEDLEELKRAGVALAVCVRSNMWFRLPPKLPEALEAGLKVMLGTDNCTFHKPDLWRELEAASLVLRRSGLYSEALARELLKAATVNAQEPLKVPWRIPLEKGSDGPLLVMDSRMLGLSRAKNKYSAVVRRGGPEALVEVLNAPGKPLIKSGRPAHPGGDGSGEGEDKRGQEDR